MWINELFPRGRRSFSAAALCAAGLTIGALPAQAQTFTVAPTPVYGSAESQLNIHYRGPGLPGAEPQQSIGTGSRHVLFDVAGYDGVIYAPVTPPYNAAAAYRTYAGQPENGADAILAQSVESPAP